MSPSLAGSEHDDCRDLAGEWGLRWTPVETDEMARAAYRINDTDRCFHCKAELMDVLVPIADAEGARIVLGVNVDDLGDHRPGQRAASEAGATFPLVAAGFTKADVRAGVAPARAAHVGQAGGGLPGQPRALRDRGLGGGAVAASSGPRRCSTGLGFEQVRVRHYGDTARIEVDLAELDRVLAARQAVVAGVRAAGYRYVTLDLEGFRSGNLNG